MSLIDGLRRVRCEINKPFSKALCAGKVKFGKRFYYRRGFFLNVAKGGNVQIGNNVFFNNYCSINCRNSITIGDGCTFGEGVRIYDHDHDFRHTLPEGDDPYIAMPIVIGENCWFGSNVVILKGVEIGDNVVVAAGTTVLKSIPSNTLIYEKHETVQKPIG